MLVEKVRALAAAHPYRVAACVYEVNGVPECIIGHALAAEGWSVAALGEESRCVLALWRGALLPGVSEADAQWLGLVQVFQDGGLTWAEAVKRADKECGQ